MAAVQDDLREREMRQLFNLVKPVGSGRGDVDAVLELPGRDGAPGIEIAFELKSSTGPRTTFSTVRDFGLHYLEKWSQMHWLFGVYSRRAGGDLELEYCMYGSPAGMKPWFDEKAAYIGPDLALVESAPDLLTDATLTSIMGDAEAFSQSEAKALMKKQLSSAQYLERADLPGNRLSRAAMLDLLRARTRYVLERGATLNNPHIPGSYFTDWPRITKDHAATLRALVRASIEGDSPGTLDLSGRTDVL